MSTPGIIAESDRNRALLAAELRTVAALRRKATPGRWRNRPSEYGRDRYVEWGKRDGGYGTATIAPADAAFIASAANLDWDLIALAVEEWLSR